MSDVITRPHHVAPNHRVKIPRSRVREMLDHLGASMSRKTTRSGAAEFGATFSPERAGSAASMQTPMAFLFHAVTGASPVALAAEQHRAAVSAARHLATTPEGCGDAVSAAEHEFYARATAAMPLTTFRDTMAVVAWVRSEFAAAAAISPESDEAPSFEAFTNRALEAVHDFLSHVQGAGDALSGRLHTSTIQALGMTFGEAVVKWRAMEAEAAAAEPVRSDAIMNERIDIGTAIITTQPQTIADALVILELLADQDTGIAVGRGDHDAAAIQRAYAVLAAELPQLRANPRAATPFKTARRAHPDAELLAAWHMFVHASKAFSEACKTMPGGGTDEDHEPYYRAIDLYRKQIEQIPARTIEGLAVQLRYLFAEKMETLDAFNAAIYGKPATEKMLAELELDHRHVTLWNMVQAANRACGVNVPSGFADTVAAFEAEAPRPLCMPQAPTARMVEAGAAAAGLNAEQMRDAYAAMAAAYLQESAA